MPSPLLTLFLSLPSSLCLQSCNSQQLLYAFRHTSCFHTHCHDENWLSPKTIHKPSIKWCHSLELSWSQCIFIAIRQWLREHFFLFFPWQRSCNLWWCPLKLLHKAREPKEVLPAHWFADLCIKTKHSYRLYVFWKLAARTLQALCILIQGMVILNW